MAILKRYVAALDAGKLFGLGNGHAIKAREGGPLFPRSPNQLTFKKDLAAVGIPTETPAGVLDFHSFRVTFVTYLGRTGTRPALGQRLSRHADQKVMMTIYDRDLEGERREAVERAEALWAKLLAKPIAEPPKPPNSLPNARDHPPPGKVA